MLSYLNKKPFRILLLGIGTVGGEVLRVLHKQYPDIQVTAVMSRNAIPCLQKQAPEYLHKLNRKQIFNSWEELQAAGENIGSIDIVIELLGGIESCIPIYHYFLQSGIPIITANKALLAEYGTELFPLARKNHTFIACEASCGGGIPILQTLLYGLRANQIHEFHGVLNGTCNFILSQMAVKESEYATALAEAQACGLAEADPFLDVSGIDTAHKLVILAMMSFGYSLRLEDIPISGIDTLGKIPITTGNKLGLTLKLVASAKLCRGVEKHLTAESTAIALRVGLCYIQQRNGIYQNINLPLMASTASPLAALDSSFNGISFYGNNVGHIYLEGRGAGAAATASAVLSDLHQIYNGSYACAFNDFPNWPEPNKLELQNQWENLTQNWLSFIPNAELEELTKKESLFEIDGYHVFFHKDKSFAQLYENQQQVSHYIPILQIPQEHL